MKKENLFEEEGVSPTPTHRGFHIMLDLMGVPYDQCVDDAGLLNLISNAATRAGCTVINSIRYRFGHNSPDGCTAIAMLDESHVAVHTYAEIGLMAVDIFTCGTEAKEKTGRIVQMIKDVITYSEINETILKRFVIQPQGSPVPVRV